MPDPSSLNIDDFLRPIREDNPSGEDLRWEDEYSLIEAAREEGDDSLSKGDWALKKPKKADWEAVISVGGRALKEKTKDLQIAAWMVEAMGRRRGLAGIRDGLRLIKALQETFWATAYPDPTDLELREGIFEFLDDPKRLPLLIKSVPLTDGTERYSYLRFRESRDVENDLTKSNEDLVRDLRNEIDAGRKIRAETFDLAAVATGRPFAQKVVDLLGECQQALDQLNASIKEPRHFGKNGATLGQTYQALEDVTKLAVDLLEAKPGGKPREPEPEPEPEEPEPEESQADDQSWGYEAAPTPKPRKTASRPSGGPIAGPEDARARIAEAARFLFEADQADPAPYLVVRALAMSGLYRSGETLDSSKLPPPATEDRQGLRRLSAEGSWDDVLNCAERVLAGPEGAGWLDARRFAMTALASLGHHDAERAARAVLGAELRDYPGWPEAELDDGTPSASSETRAWLVEAFPLPQAPEPTYFAPLEDHRPTPSNGETTEGPEDPWDQVQSMLRDGRAQEAITMVSRTVREARTGRERFLRTFQQAEVCLTLGRPGVATTLLEGLARQIDELRLDHWEDTTLCARVVAALYRCLKGKDDARARSVYERLCQLDIGQAMSLGDVGDA